MLGHPCHGVGGGVLGTVTQKYTVRTTGASHWAKKHKGSLRANAQKEISVRLCWRRLGRNKNGFLGCQ